MADAPQTTRGEAGFADRLAELSFNKLPFGREPDVIASPRSEDEVVELVREARRGGRKVAVLSGGHSWIGAAFREGGLLIEMSAFAAVEVDVAARTARVGPAVRGGALAERLAADGLAFPAGHCGTPAFGGYILGGGLGLNWGQWKPACYSLRSVRVVTAAGDLLVATDDDHRDLLWLARGSGPGFPGVITEFEIELHERPADTRVSSWLFSLDDLADVCRWVSDVSPALPAKVEVATELVGPARPEHPPADGFPDQVVGVTAIAFAENAAEAQAALEPMSSGPGIPALAHGELEPVPFELLHRAADTEYPPDHRYLADAFWTDRDVAAALVPLQDEFRRAPSGKNVVIALMPGNGARQSLSPEIGAYSIDERTLVMPYSIWTDPAADRANRDWMAKVVDRLEPLSTGHFVSEADLEAHPERLAKSFAPANWERVLSLREEWDPDRLFHDGPGYRVQSS